MPYSMALYPNERYPVLKVGDTFVVVEVDKDFHWGKCVHIALRPLIVAKDREVPAMSLKECEALYGDAFFEAMELEKKLP